MIKHGVGVHVGMDGWKSKGSRVGWSRHRTVTLRSHFPNSASCARPCPGGAGPKKQIMTGPPKNDTAHQTDTDVSPNSMSSSAVAVGQCICCG